MTRRVGRAETPLFMSMDYDEILGVHPTAEEFVIRAAYRALARRYHPDKLGPDESGLADRMAQINEAYDDMDKGEVGRGAIVFD